MIDTFWKRILRIKWERHERRSEPRNNENEKNAKCSLDKINWNNVCVRSDCL